MRVAVERPHVDRRERRGDVERHAVLLGEHGDGVGADLVGGVAVGGDAVGADDDEVDAALPHQHGRHVVGDDGRVDAVAHQFPGREPRALQDGPRLVGEDRYRAALLDGAANHAERGAVAGRGQRARVAVREDAGLLRDEGAAEAADGAAAGDILVMDGLRLGQHQLAQVLDAGAGEHCSENTRFMRSIAQKRLTAVGRVAASRSQSFRNSVVSCLVPAALLRRTPSARP